MHNNHSVPLSWRPALPVSFCKSFAAAGLSAFRRMSLDPFDDFECSVVVDEIRRQQCLGLIEYDPVCTKSFDQTFVLDKFFEQCSYLHRLSPDPCRVPRALRPT